MAAKRRTRRPRSDDSEEFGRNRGNDGSHDDDDAEEESGKSSDTAVSAEPKEMPLKQPSSPSSEDAGSQGSGEASPARSLPRGGVAMKTKKTSSKRLKKPPPASPEEGEAEDSGDASPATGPLPDDSADAGHKNATATPKRGEKRSPPPRQEEERPNKRAAGPDAETVAASAPQRKKKSKKKKDMRKKDGSKKKGKKQRTMALTKPTSPPQFLESGLNDNREDTPSSPDIAQEEQHHGREKAEQEPSNTSPPQDEHGAREEEQKEKNIAEKENAGDISPTHGKDMHSAHGEEHQEKEVANQEFGDDTSSPKDNHSADEEEQLGEEVPQKEQPMDTSPPQEKNRDLEDVETGAQVNGKALLGRNAPSTKPHGSETEKKPAVERSWSYDDELKILYALVVHFQSHDGAFPDPSHLLANITFDKIDANEEKLTDKIRKLKSRYRRNLSQGCPSDVRAHRLFKLSEILWGQVAEDERVEPTSRDFSVLSELYPHLAKEVQVYAKGHRSGDLIMEIFKTIGDEKARDLDAKFKKQQIEALKLDLGQASLINELLSALTSLTHVKV